MAISVNLFENLLILLKFLIINPDEVVMSKKHEYPNGLLKELRSKAEPFDRDFVKSVQDATKKALKKKKPKAQAKVDISLINALLNR